jgi:hypothetical protein
MTLPQSDDPIQEEIKRRAHHLAVTRGKLIDGDEGWDYQVQVGLVHVIVAKHNNKLVSVSLKDGGPGFKAVWHWSQPDGSCLEREHYYGKVLEELRQAMILDDLATV